MLSITAWCSAAGSAGGSAGETGPAVGAILAEIQPADAAGYRIAVTTLDQDSAEVLMEIIATVPRDDDATAYYRSEVEDHWRYSQSATVASGSIEMQRILLSRALLGGGKR